MCLSGAYLAACPKTHTPASSSCYSPCALPILLSICFCYSLISWVIQLEAGRWYAGGQEIPNAARLKGCQFISTRGLFCLVKVVGGPALKAVSLQLPQDETYPRSLRPCTWPVKGLLRRYQEWHFWSVTPCVQKPVAAVQFLHCRGLHVQLLNTWIVSVSC